MKDATTTSLFVEKLKYHRVSLLYTREAPDMGVLIVAVIVVHHEENLYTVLFYSLIYTRSTPIRAINNISLYVSPIVVEVHSFRIGARTPDRELSINKSQLLDFTYV